MRFRWASIAFALLFVPGAQAQERRESLEHAGSIGLLAGLGPVYSTLVAADCITCGGTQVLSGVSGALDLGATMAIGAEGVELTARLRLTRLSTSSGESLLLGVRRTFGADEWKTYFEIELEGILRPKRLLGPRAALGAMLDLSSVFGLYAEGGLGVELGGGRRFGVDVTIGAQARSFLFQ